VEKTSKSGSVEKALQILECFDRKNHYLTLDQISKITSYPKTTVFRMLCSLEKFGYIKRKYSSRELEFGLGWSFLEKGQLVADQIDLREISKQDMIDLRDETELSVQLAIREGTDAVYIEQFPSLKPIRIYPEIGRRAPLYSAACPRVLLAFAPKHERNSILDQFNYKHFTSNTITNKEGLINELDKIVLNGYAISRGELHEGTLAVAVPIYSNRNNVIASLSLIGLEKEFIMENIRELIKSLNNKAKRISEKIKTSN
jgi:IclR family transcriptional regulator, KDG regulon repressor